MSQFKKKQAASLAKYWKYLFLCMCFCAAMGTNLNAQNDETEDLVEISEPTLPTEIQDSIPEMDKHKIDTTRLRIGGLEIVIKDRGDGNGDVDVFSHKEIDDDHSPSNDRIQTRYFMLDIGSNTYLSDGKFNLPNELNNMELDYGKSVNINLHLFRQRIGLIGKNLNFMYGLELTWNNYHFAEDITLIHDVDELTIVEENINFKKNAFSTTFLQVPVLLNIETNPNKLSRSFRLSAGVYGGVLLGARTKQKSSEKGKVKIKDDFNLNKFRYGAIGQIGFGCVNFYVDYALNDLFKESQGPELTPISIGFSLVPF